MTELAAATLSPVRRAAASTRPRLHGLDGVRGVAAAVVVLHHLALSGGWLSDPFAKPPTLSSRFEIVMTYTPLHLLWAGGEAVFVFFVLSGYVLAHTDLSTPRRVTGFVGKRFVRLYVPAAAALVLATGQYLLVRRHAGPQGSWLHWHGDPVAWSDPLRAATLIVTDSGTQIDSVLWSLHWEVLFSVLLPVVAACMAVAIGRRAPYVGTALLACIALSIYQSSGALFYLPMFLLGTLAALNATSIEATVQRWQRHMPDGVMGLWAMMIGGLMLTIRWTMNPLRIAHGHALQEAIAGLEQMVTVLGACIIVLAAVHVRSVRRMFEVGALVRLGGRSFSLYLVHEPIIVSVAQRFDPQRRPMAFIATALVVIAVVTELFFRLVERPSIALAQRVYRRAVPA